MSSFTDMCRSWVTVNVGMIPAVSGTWAVFETTDDDGETQKWMRPVIGWAMQNQYLARGEQEFEVKNIIQPIISPGAMTKSQICDDSTKFIGVFMEDEIPKDVSVLR